MSFYAEMVARAQAGPRVEVTAAELTQLRELEPAGYRFEESWWGQEGAPLLLFGGRPVVVR